MRALGVIGKSVVVVGIVYRGFGSNGVLSPLFGKSARRTEVAIANFCLRGKWGKMGTLNLSII